MAVNSPGAYIPDPRSPSSSVTSAHRSPKSPKHFTFPRSPSSPRQFGPKSPSSPRNFGPKSPSSPRNFGPKSPSSPRQFGPKSPSSPRQFGPKSPSTSNHFNFPPDARSPSGSRSPNHHSEFPFCTRKSTDSSQNSPKPDHRTSTSEYSSTSSWTDLNNTSTSRTSSSQHGSGSRSTKTEVFELSVRRGDVSSRRASEGSAISSSYARSRRSTSDLTDLDEECVTTATSLSRPSSPRGRAGSIKGGGLAYLASRRGSRESVVSNNAGSNVTSTNASNEDIGPLNSFMNNPRGRQRRTSNFLELPVPDHVRPRVCSLPEKAYNPRCGDDLYRLRTFSITKGGVVNCGDSIINRRSKSNTSVNSTANSSRRSHSNLSGVSPGDRSPFEGSCCGSSYNNISSETSLDEAPKYRVVLLGDAGVGKTALVSQFMTSEYMNTYDASLDDEFGEKTVSVLLDGEESEMVFIDHPSVEMSVENSLSTYEPHACVVVYSVVNRATFKTCEDILNYLWQENYTHDKSVIVVGNKADLARSRVIQNSEGKSLAASRDCKFIETSSGIQHNVDELLVGILKQIRLRECREKKRQQRRGSKTGGKSNHGRLHGSRTSLSLNIAREILHKMCINDSKSKSCENLHVL